MAKVRIKVTPFTMDVECPAIDEDEVWDWVTTSETFVERALDCASIIEASYDEIEPDEDDEDEDEDEDEISTDSKK